MSLEGEAEVVARAGVGGGSLFNYLLIPSDVAGTQRHADTSNQNVERLAELLPWNFSFFGKMEGSGCGRGSGVGGGGGGGYRC